MVVIMELKKYKNNNKRKPYVLIVIGFLLISISAYLFYESYALYEEIKDFNVINGTVEDPGDIYFAYYIDGEISREMPSQNTGYTLNNEKTNCNNGVTVTWDNASWEAKVNYKSYNATSNTRTKCTLYFNKTAKTVSTVLGNIEVNSYTPDFTKSSCDDETCESREKGIYETTDYDGNPTYYYRGSAENNYVKFAGYYWRIIRINSNGSVRMIYDGTSAHYNGEASEDRRLKDTQFNSSSSNKSSIGYMYTTDQILGTGNSSILKTKIDEFYKNNLINYEKYIDKDVGFCGDRAILSQSSSEFLNKSIYRVMYNKPTNICENDEDYYTVSSTSNGNRALIYPIATLSIYDAIYAGHAGTLTVGSLVSKKPTPSTYLICGFRYWTMTPAGLYAPFVGNTSYGFVYGVNSNGVLEEHGIGNQFFIKPVINIRSDVTIIGSGTMMDQYVVN